MPARLPRGLTVLNCEDNKLQGLPKWLPCGLVELRCDVNEILELPELPLGLHKLYVAGNPLCLLPDLPADLVEMDIVQCDSILHYYWDIIKSEGLGPPRAGGLVSLWRYKHIIGQNGDIDTAKKYIRAINKMNERHAIVRNTTRMQVINKDRAIEQAYWSRVLHPSKLQPLLDDEDRDVDEFMEEHTKWL